jgi:peptidoglycan/xylan/chitin deacetylase (PgdA/CDA1 family)
MLTDRIQHAIRTADATFARLYLSVFRERPALSCFLFHSLFLDERELSRNLVDPLQRTTVEQFRAFIQYYSSLGYRFITPADLLNDLEPGRRYALITFDDGYFNNMRALPVLEEFAVPATFFIATDFVRDARSFWWDVLYRERVARGADERAIYGEALSLKSLRTEQIEQQLEEVFGQQAFQPRGDVDRPFTTDELRNFARHEFVTLGNHTAHHAILTNYTPAEMRQQLRDAQDALRQITGTAPIAIAYPNGDHDNRVLQACRDTGLKIGFTIRPEKNRLSINPASQDRLRLGRFSTHGASPILTQCRTYRSDILLYGMFRDGYLRFIRRPRLSHCNPTNSLP